MKMKGNYSPDLYKPQFPELMEPGALRSDAIAKSLRIGLIEHMAPNLVRVTEEMDPDRPCIGFLRTNWYEAAEEGLPSKVIEFASFAPFESDTNTAIMLAQETIKKKAAEGDGYMMNFCVGGGKETFSALLTKIQSTGEGEDDLETEVVASCESDSPAIAICMAVAPLCGFDLTEVMRDLFSPVPEHTNGGVPADA